MFIQVNQLSNKTFVSKSKKDSANENDYKHIYCGTALINTNFIEAISISFFTYDPETLNVKEEKTIYEVRFNNEDEHENILIDKESYDKVCRLLENKDIEI